MELQKPQVVEVTNFSKAFFGALLTLLTLAAAWTVDSTVAMKTDTALLSLNVSILVEDFKQLKLELKESDKDKVMRPEMQRMEKRVMALERYK